MSDLETINKAFLDAFTEDDLRQLVKFNLDVNLASIVEGGNLRSVIFAVTSWAGRHGRLPALVQAAKDSTSNPLIEKLEIPLENSFVVIPEVEVLGTSDVNSSEFYKTVNDITRMDVMLRGSGAGDEGFVGRTNRKLKEIDKEMDGIKETQTDLLGKVGDLDGMIRRPSVDRAVINSVYFRFVIYLFLFFTFVSFVFGAYIVWTQ